MSTETGWRGGERQVSFLTQGLVAREVRTVVACVPGSPLSMALKKAGVEVVDWKPRFGEWDFSASNELVRFAKDCGAHTIHAHTSHAHALALRACRKLRIPLIVSRRVDFAISRNWLSRRKYLAPEVHYIAISKAVADALKAGGVSVAKIHLVPSGIDPERYPFRKELHSPMLQESGVPVLLNVAALTDHKDQATLLRALAELKARGQAFTARIAGTGELEADLKELAMELGVNEEVEFLGHVDNVPEEMAGADIFVLTSHMEGLGSSLLDAMAAGLPIVATDAGGIPELIENETTGLLVPIRNPNAVADAIHRLLNDEGLANRLRMEAHSRMMSQFTCDAMTEGTLQVYHRIVGRET